MSMVKELVSEKEWLQAFPVMNELRTHLNRESFLEVLYQMYEDGYKLFALYDQEQIVAVMGIIAPISITSL